MNLQYTSNLKEELKNLPTIYLGVDYGLFPEKLYEVYRQDHIKDYFNKRNPDSYTRMVDRINEARNKGNFLFFANQHGNPIYHEVIEVNGWSAHLNRCIEQYKSRKIQSRHYVLKASIKIIKQGYLF